MENIEQGIGFIVLATVINGALGWYLIRQGKKYHSIVLEANGKDAALQVFKIQGISLPKVRIGNSCVNDEKNIQN